MGEGNSAKGQCLCGSVEVTAGEINRSVGACHCNMCRRWGGGPLLAIDCGTNVIFVGKDQVGTFASSDWAERGFCRNCGTHLYYRLKESGQYIMPAGLFDPTELEFDHQIFIDEKPSYYDFANETRNMTGAEVFAMYAPPSGS